MNTTIEPRWLTVARADMNKRETLGPNDAPWLRVLLAKHGLTWLAGQPWCGIIMADWMRSAGIDPPAKAFRALSWLNWGTPLGAPAVGAVVVFTRLGGGHVGMVVGKDTVGRILVLGGNQGDRVCIAPFDPKRVAGYVFPPGQIHLLRPGVLPVMTASGASSSNEA